MADQQIEESKKTLRDYVMPSIDGAISSIRRPIIQAEQFEIKPTIIQIIEQTIEFGGLSQEDLNVCIENFLEIYSTFKHNRVTDDAVHLRLFPFFLRDIPKA